MKDFFTLPAPVPQIMVALVLFYIADYALAM